jgi:glycosyltransferase involved in cell wall biosynthesis
MPTDLSEFRVGSSLSIIIPTWQEAPLIGDAVRSARRLGDEVIVVDGRSPDGTAARAAEAGAKVILAPKGRGVQLHAGAIAARGNVLLFLHADARLPARARLAIFAHLKDPRVIGGNFLIRFWPESWFTRLLVPANDRRRRLTHRFYGDSGIFVRRPNYFRLGGFEPWPVMHDYAFSARMHRAGRTAYIRDPAVLASARRFEGRELRTLARWVAIQGLYWLFVPPRVLGRLYPDVRGDRPQQFIEEWRSVASETEVSSGGAGRRLPSRVRPHRPPVLQS